MNERLYEKTPTAMFMAGGFMELNISNMQLSVWNCSIPEILIFRNGVISNRVASQFFAIGMTNLPDAPYSVFDVEPGDKVFAYSDGFTEETNLNGEMFGAKMMEELLANIISKDAPLDIINTTLKKFREGLEQSDDMTIVELTC
jgi:serine phosphatase RsbU (regulator of sigma subunit)